jgi:energy-coupling factor transporter ATP-binding protein EcfA2
MFDSDLIILDEPTTGLDPIALIHLKELIRQEKEKGKTILEMKMNEYSEVNFKKPNGAYQAVFDAGEGHQVYVDGKDIVE